MSDYTSTPADTELPLFTAAKQAAGLVEPSSPRALGAVMQHGVKEGWIGQMATTHGIVSRPSGRSNGQLKRVWKSLIYLGQTSAK